MLMVTHDPRAAERAHATLHLDKGVLVDADDGRPMKYLPLLVRATCSGRKVRTVLTMGSFAVALFLFCLLVAIRGAFNQGVEVAGADRLVVINKVSLIQPLPLAYRDRSRACPG